LAGIGDRTRGDRRGGDRRGGDRRGGDRGAGAGRRRLPGSVGATHQRFGSRGGGVGPLHRRPLQAFGLGGARPPAWGQQSSGLLAGGAGAGAPVGEAERSPGKGRAPPNPAALRRHRCSRLPPSSPTTTRRVGAKVAAVGGEPYGPSAPTSWRCRCRAGCRPASSRAGWRGTRSVSPTRPSGQPGWWRSTSSAHRGPSVATTMIGAWSAASQSQSRQGRATRPGGTTLRSLACGPGFRRIGLRPMVRDRVRERERSLLGLGSRGPLGGHGAAAVPAGARGGPHGRDADWVDEVGREPCRSTRTVLGVRAG
jgi:hypothetical protein